MRARVQGVAILACTAVVATAGFTAAVASAADSQGAAPAAVVLLSRNRPVTASSAGGCCAPRNAVDGKSTTRWASTAGKDPQWIYVDLGAVAMVSRARLQWDRSCATAYQLQTSTNHTTWTTIFSTTTGKGGVEDRTGLTGSGRYLRMLGTHRCRSDGTHGYSLQELDVFGIIGDPQPPTAPGPPAQVSITSNSVTVTWAAATDGNVSPRSPTLTVHTPPGPPASNPYGDPNLVSMFNGTTLDGWTQSRPDGWVVRNGAIHGTGAGRGWIYYNPRQVGSFRWIFNLRQVTGDHAPTVLIWGTTNPIRDALSAIQFQPPNGGHWDYRPGHNNGGGSLFKQLPHTKIDIHVWSQCEIIANMTTGVARMACCPLAPDATTCKAVEVLQFRDPTAGRVGPLAIPIHNSGIQDEYRGLYFESPMVMSPDQFITT